MGLTRPGRTLALATLWQRLNFLPLPHQHGSFALSTPWRVDRSVTATKAIGATMGRCPRSTPSRPCGWRSIELVQVPMRAGHAAPHRGGPAHASATCVLVRVRADEAEGWAECAVEPEPTYAPEFTDAAVLALRDHLLPRALAGPVGDAVALGPLLDAVRGHPMARAALELAVLDAQLRAAGRSLASWLGATATAVEVGRGGRASTTTSTTSWPRPTRRWRPAPCGSG